MQGKILPRSRVYGMIYGTMPLNQEDGFKNLNGTQMELFRFARADYHWK
jgi:hypothetical protein